MNNSIKNSLLSLALMALVSPAGAAIIFTPGNHPEPNEENVLFNGPGTFAGPGTTVTGMTQTSGFLVSISSSELLTTPAQGQARVDAVVGGFTDLSISLPGGTFTDIIFALNPEIPGTRGSALITVLTQNSTFNFQFGPGNTFLTILATGGDTISSVTISSTTEIGDIRQIRISGASNGTVIRVPEPGTLALLSAALLGVALRQRRRQRG